MKRKEGREIAIGGLALAALVVVLATSYRSGGFEAPNQSNGYHVTATFNRIDGLLTGDPVYLSGVKIGRVGGMTLTDDYRALVAFHIDSDVPLPRDTAAAIHTDGLFGSKFVTLDPGGEERNLADGDRMRYTQDALIVGKLLDLIIAQGKAVRRQQGQAGKGN